MKPNVTQYEGFPSHKSASRFICYTTRLSLAASTQIGLLVQSTTLTEDCFACFNVTNVVSAEIITYLATRLARFYARCKDLSDTSGEDEVAFVSAFVGKSTRERYK